MRHNIGTELAVIGACLLDEDALRYAARHAAAEDFYDSRHARIFQAVIDISNSGVMPDALILQSYSAKWDTPISQTEIAACIEAVTTTASIPTYVSILKDCAARRRLAAIATELYKAADSAEPVSPTIEAYIDKLSKADITKRLGDGSISQYFASDEIEMDRWTEGLPRFGAGIEVLDAQYQDGILPGQIYYIVGAQGSLKTAFMLNGVRDFLQRTNRTAVFFSLDMTGEEIKDRLMAITGGMTPHEARLLYKSNPVQYAELRKRTEAEYSRLRVYDEARTTEAMQKVIAYERPALVAIDFITAIDMPEIKTPSDYAKLSRAEEWLRTCKNRFPNVIWVILNQMSEQSKLLQTKGDIGLGRGRGGGALTNIVHVGIELSKDREAAREASFSGNAPPWLIATIFKNRSGVSGKSYKLGYSGPTMEFTGQAEEVVPVRKGKPIFELKTGETTIPL